MSGPIEYDPADDPLYRDVPLRHRTTIPVLGIPVRFLSNAPALPEIAEAAFGAWRVLDDAPDLVEPPSSAVTVTVVVQPGDEGGAEHAEITHRVVGHNRLLFNSPGSVGHVDADRGEAVAFVSPALMADREHFRYAVLEAMTLGLVTPLDRQPLHAAAVARDDTAVLLAGPSGVGKSTLAYAAARAGLTVLAEDTVHLQTQPLRAWGLPGYLHLPVDARERFPELRGVEPTLVAAGREKLVIELRDLDAVPRRPVAERAVLCVLDRADGSAPGLRSADPDAVVRAITTDLEPGFDLFAETIGAPARRLARQGAWRLSLPDDPTDAIPWIEELLDASRR